MTLPPAIPAATLILVRDRAGEPPELLMVERAATMAFAAGALVFPGGRIDPADIALGDTLGVEHGASIVAAIRETIEETAVPVALDPMPSPSLALELQRELLAEIPLAALLDRHAIKLRADVLTLFTHWIPNLHASRRFDTRFFIAAAPPGEWRPTIGERENSSAEWMSAAEALTRDADGRASLIFPTRTTLRRLALHGSHQALLADANAHRADPISPWIEQIDGAPHLTIPADLGFPVVREPLEGLRRG